jgi:hypothetical protein
MSLRRSGPRVELGPWAGRRLGGRLGLEQEKDRDRRDGEHRDQDKTGFPLVAHRPTSSSVDPGTNRT